MTRHGVLPSGGSVPGGGWENNLAELERTIGYRFADRRLLEEALTHRSYVNEAVDPAVRDNERLEFFGDAAIDFFLSRMLLDRFPHSREGDLTRIRASLVGEENLGALARRIGLGNCLRLGRGEEKSGGREKRSILADAYEALVASLVLDGGGEPARDLVTAHFTPFLDGECAVAVGRDCKTELQELSQALYGTVPRYLHGEPAGPDHARVFTARACIGDEVLGEGTGKTKKEAEQEAARSALARLGPDGMAGAR